MTTLQGPDTTWTGPAALYNPASLASTVPSLGSYGSGTELQNVSPPQPVKRLYAFQGVTDGVSVRDTVAMRLSAEQIRNFDTELRMLQDYDDFRAKLHQLSSTRTKTDTAPRTRADGEQWAMATHKAATALAHMRSHIDPWNTEARQPAMIVINGLLKPPPTEQGSPEWSLVELGSLYFPRRAGMATKTARWLTSTASTVARDLGSIVWSVGSAAVESASGSIASALSADGGLSSHVKRLKSSLPGLKGEREPSWTTLRVKPHALPLQLPWHPSA